MACWLNVAVVGLPPLAKSVAVAIVKTPQSLHRVALVPPQV